jgi:hypothetical protein
MNQNYTKHSIFTVIITQNFKRMKTIITFSLFFFFITSVTLGQTSLIKGVVKDENGAIIEKAIITCKGKEVISSLDGTYSIEIPTEKAVKITFSHPSFQVYSRRIMIRKKKITFFSPKLTNKLIGLL